MPEPKEKKRGNQLAGNLDGVFGDTTSQVTVQNDISVKIESGDQNSVLGST